MSDEGYPASNWEHTDSDHPSSVQNHAYNSSPYFPRDSLDVPGVPLTPTKSASPPRSSLESPTRMNHMRWRDSVPQPGQAALSPAEDGILDSSFDENVLRALCNLDCGVPLMLDRIKQSTASCKEVATFLKKRMEMEAEYGRNLQKLARNTAETYAQHDAKAGSFMGAWKHTLKLHEDIAASHIKMASNLKEQIEELSKVIDGSERERKQTKDLAGRYERALQDAESATEKSKNRVEITAEELERVLIQKEGESLRDTGVQGRSPGGHRTRVIGKAVAKGGMLLKGKNPGNIQRQEDDIRQRMSAASDQYRKNMTDTQAIRQEYFNFQLPRILRALQSCLNDVDLGIQYHLIRYAFLFESTVLGDGTTLAPLNPDDAGLKAIAESIDNRGDFKTFMQNYAVAHNGPSYRGPRRDGPRDEGYLPPIAPLSHQAQSNSPNMSVSHIDKGRPTFGVDLAEQLVRDDAEVPPIMVKCCEAIEKYGLHTQGIYRVGGTITKVKELRERLDRDLDSVNLDADEWASEISVVTSVLKQWLRELPNPLMTFELHEDFLEAARVENDRLRHIRLHERVNELPDPNYATLKYFMGHLHRIVECEAENAMSVQNLAIVFGPTLFKQATPGANGNMNGMADASQQNKAIETILEHYTDIFVDEGDEEQGAEQ
ncbi:RhoGAP-domain-containing protein [Phanerochaete sordida]|uniref:RhoGAP-domain-containing protein n=1 Tax=Phanerochaete sordida TaxID=48140 RepID=A0A9P3LF89_9APHY|nr:RhoGAP-domain-containing protein [Phanerochaete sordida]